MSGRKADVIKAAHLCAEAALRLVKPGNQVSDGGAVGTARVAQGATLGGKIKVSAGPAADPPNGAPLNLPLCRSDASAAVGVLLLSPCCYSRRAWVSRSCRCHLLKGWFVKRHRVQAGG